MSFITLTRRAELMNSYITDARLQIKISALYWISGPCYICQYGDSWTMLKIFQKAKYFIKLYPFSGLKGSFTTRNITVMICNNIHETVHCSGLWVVVFFYFMMCPSAMSSAMLDDSEKHD